MSFDLTLTPTIVWKITNNYHTSLMNERLEKEIERWKYKRCSYDEHGDISATAQHFYDLALADVREGVQDSMYNENYASDAEYSCDNDEAGRKHDYCYERLEKIRDFIDNLTK